MAARSRSLMSMGIAGDARTASALRYCGLRMAQLNIAPRRAALQ